MSLIWNQEIAQEAANKLQYVVVTNIGLPHLNVTDFQTVWAVEPEFIFNPTYRIAGNAEDIYKVINNNYELKDEAIVEIIDDSINVGNFEEEKSDSYAKELKIYNNWKCGVLNEAMSSKDKSLVDLLKLINPHMEAITPVSNTKKPVFTQTKKTPTKNESPSKGRGRKGTSIQEKLEKLPDGKLLNVSKLTDAGIGATTADRPGKTRLFISTSLPIITNNLDGFLTAIQLLGDDIEDYGNIDDIISEAEIHFSGKASPSPKAKTTTTSSKAPIPSGRTGKTISNIIPHSDTIVPEAVRPARPAIPTARKNLIPSPKKVEVVYEDEDEEEFELPEGEDEI